ncbi:unnamed protein product [Nippostrongylus brasiliensis]|uniref:Uncharacterized protein n=1 Tax=Nippostrongylus brasiliensis TaxID=27835 RepID=A0A0N4XRP1_NIPBR|nr:unnamed protein product [Nippostrongylus brasiliensis]VDL68783.1 unnamed protein product [Nippostrongylus brasiliensis]
MFVLNLLVYRSIELRVRREIDDCLNRCFALMDSVLVNLIPTEVLRCISSSNDHVN